MDFLKRVLTWWNSQTLGTQLFTWRHGRRLAATRPGNIFYATKNGARLWVIYNGEAEASRVSPEWHGWLHHTWDEPPSTRPLSHKSWEKPHIENLDGHRAGLCAPRLDPAGRAGTAPRLRGLDAGIAWRENVTEVVTGAIVLIAGAGFLVYARSSPTAARWAAAPTS